MGSVCLSCLPLHCIGSNNVSHAVPGKETKKLMYSLILFGSKIYVCFLYSYTGKPKHFPP